MLCLDPLQLAHDAVVLVVRNLRIVEDVVSVIVVADRFAQRDDPRGGVSRLHGRPSLQVRSRRRMSATLSRR